MTTKAKREALEDAVVAGQEAKKHLRIAMELIDKIEHHDVVAAGGEIFRGADRLSTWLDGAELAVGL
jgi:hypothetical protein